MESTSRTGEMSEWKELKWGMDNKNKTRGEILSGFILHLHLIAVFPCNFTFPCAFNICPWYIYLRFLWLSEHLELII